MSRRVGRGGAYAGRIHRPLGVGKFAKQVDVVTLEWENVPVEALEILKPHIAVHPSADVLRVAQDREQEKTFARMCGIGTAEYIVAHSAAELEKLLPKFRCLPF